MVFGKFSTGTAVLVRYWYLKVRSKTYAPTVVFGKFSTGTAVLVRYWYLKVLILKIVLVLC